MNHPALPPTCDHPLLISWLAVETCLLQRMRDGIFNKTQSEDVEKEDNGLASPKTDDIASDSVHAIKRKYHKLKATRSSIAKSRKHSNSIKTAPFLQSNWLLLKYGLTMLRIEWSRALKEIQYKQFWAIWYWVAWSIACSSASDKKSPAHRVRVLILLRRLLNLGP